MEVIYPKACGVDVHKSFLVAVICDPTSFLIHYFSYINFIHSSKNLVWLSENWSFSISLFISSIDAHFPPFLNALFCIKNSPSSFWINITTVIYYLPFELASPFTIVFSVILLFSLYSLVFPFIPFLLHIFIY